MANGRIATPNLDLGTYPLGQNPGAGPQNVSETDPTKAGKGSNGDKIKLDIAIGTEHNATGTHKNAVIDGANLKSTVADDSTIKQDASTKKLRVMSKATDADAGVGTNQIKNDAVTGAEIADNSIVQAHMTDGSIGTNELIDASVTLAKHAADSVDATKITHDNNRTKGMLVFLLKSLATGTWAFHGDQQLNANLGVPMPRAGKLTRMYVKDNSATAGSKGADLGYAAGVAFAEGAHIGVTVTVTSVVKATVN